MPDVFYVHPDCGTVLSGVAVQICQGLDPHSRRSGSHGALPPESVQRTALRAVCTIIDAFHFVGSGGRLRTAALLQPAADAAAQQRLRQASGLAPPGAAAVLPDAAAAAPATGTPGKPNSSAAPAGHATGDAEATGVVRGVSSAGNGGEDADADGEALLHEEGGDGDAAAEDADDPAAVDGEQMADQEGVQEEVGVEDLEGAEVAMDEAAGESADRGRDLESRIQKVLVGRVLPALLRMMHKVRSAPALTCYMHARHVQCVLRCPG